MEAIYIPQLARAPEQAEKVQVCNYLPYLDTLTPVQGEVYVVHKGNYLEVKGKAEAIVTLSCDRCLQQYNHRVTVDASELIWLQKIEDEIEDGSVEREVAFDDLLESVDPEGYFQPVDWLYQQFCLAIPPRQLCDAQCPGIPIESHPSEPLVVDRRWASLESFKEHLQN